MATSQGDAVASHGDTRAPDQAAAYDAFISYSHRDDEDLALAVQAGLQRFAKPWYRLRALRVFRDRANLSLEPGLWASVEKALSSARWLILLASAGAAESVWVNREVSWWLAHRSPRRLLIVATSPGLAWDAAAADWAAAAPVPPALRGVLADRPLWADLAGLSRAGRRRLPDEVLANLAAPIRGRPKDEIFGEHLREHRRAMRLARAAISGLALLTAAAVVAAGLAINATRNANRQRDLVARQRDLAASGEAGAESEDFDATDPATAALLAAAAGRIAMTPQALESLLRVSAQPERAVLTMNAFQSGPQAAVFSPDGKILVTAGSEQLRFWHPAAPYREIGAPVPAGSVCALSFSPAGRLLAVIADDGTTRVWDAASHRRLGPAMAAGGSGINICGLAFRPGGGELATGSSSGRIRLWDLRTHRQLGPAMSAGSSAIGQLAFSPDGRLLASADASGMTRIWDVRRRRQTGPPMRDPGGQGRVAFSADGRLLATVGGGDIRIWSAASHRQLGPPLPASGAKAVNGIAFSPAGPLLATADADGTARLWDVATRRLDGPALVTATAVEMDSVAFSPGGQTLVTASGNGTARLWDIALFRQAGPALAGSARGGVTAQAFSPRGRLLATAGADGTARLWDLGTHRQLGPAMAARDRKPLLGVTFSQDGRLLATAGADGRVRLWDAAAHRQLGAALPGVPSADVRPGSANLLAFSRRRPLLAAVGAVGSDTGVRLWNPVTHRQAGRPVAPVSGAAAVAVSPDGRLLAIGEGNDTAALWSLSSHRQLGADMVTGNTFGTGPGSFGTVQGIAFSPDGHTLATADEDIIQLWHVATQTPDGAPFRAGRTGSASVAFSPDGSLLVTADGAVQLWDVATQRPVGPALTPGAGRPGAASFSPDGRTLAVTDADGTARLLDVAFPRDLTGAACALAGRSLTRREWHAYVPAEPYRTVCP